MSDILAICILFLFYLRGSAHAVVDCGGPAYGLTTDQSCVEIDAVFPPPTTLVGGNYTIPCKTLLVRTMASIDYCPVGVCESNGQWTSPALSCGSSECVNGSSVNYIGKRICTISGRMCQRWDSQTPHPHPYTTPSSYPDDTLSDAGSYCRDPGGVNSAPWCFSTDPDVEWETCDIPNCGDMNITQGTCPNNYCGDPEVTVESDDLCTSAHVPAFTRGAGSAMKSFCSSLLAGVVSNMSYCPVLRCQPDTTWAGLLRMACGENECYDAGNSDLYTGGRLCTENGWTCQNWDDQSPHPHSYSLPGVGGYCRDPNKDRGKPWCYTTNPAVEWEFCDIPECSSLIADQGTCTVTTSVPSTTLPPSTTTVTVSTSTSVATSTSTTSTLPASSPSTASPTSTVTSSTSAGTPSTTTPAPTVPGIPVPGQKYQRTGIDVDGYRLLYTVPNSISNVRCSQHCSQEPVCVLFTVEPDRTCTLYEMNISVTDTILCSAPTLKCFERV